MKEFSEKIFRETEFKEKFQQEIYNIPSNRREHRRRTLQKKNQQKNFRETELKKKFNKKFIKFRQIDVNIGELW